MPVEILVKIVLVGNSNSFLNGTNTTLTIRIHLQIPLTHHLVHVWLQSLCRAMTKPLTYGLLLTFFLFKLNPFHKFQREITTQSSKLRLLHSFDLRVFSSDNDRITNQMLFVTDFMLNHANVNKFLDKSGFTNSRDKLIVFFLQKYYRYTIIHTYSLLSIIRPGR